MQPPTFTHSGPVVLLKAVTALVTAAAWGTLGYGMLFSTPDRRAWGDLEAGGRFSINLFVYLPYFALTLAVATVVVLGVLPRPTWLSPLAVTLGVVALFGGWVLSADDLLVAQPELARYGGWCLVIDAAAVLPLTAALALRPGRNQVPSHQAW